MKKIAIFDEELDIRISKDDTFRVYISRPEEEKEKRMGSSLIFLMHGGGASSYTWAPIVSGLRKHAYVAAFDARGHGHSISSNEANISVEVLIQDAMNVLERIVRYVKEDAKSEEKVSVAMVGHSFGGAIAAKVTAKFTSSKSMELKCLVLIDICEGTAMNSLGHTKVFLQRRPSHFRTEQDAVNWSLNKGTLRNRSSAAMSVPDTLVHEKTGEIEHFRWRTNLLASYKYWEGWYKGLSNIFVTIPASRISKLLLLADVNRLDKDLTIAQMQGKFEMKIVGHSGHFIHEDVPSAAVNVLNEFFRRRLT